MNSTGDLGNWQVPIIEDESNRYRDSYFQFRSLADFDKINENHRQGVQIFASTVLETVLGRGFVDAEVDIFLNAAKCFSQKHLKDSLNIDLQYQIFALKCIAYHIPELHNKLAKFGFFLDIEKFFTRNSARVPENVKNLVFVHYNEAMTNYRAETGDFSFIRARVKGEVGLNSESTTREQEYDWRGWLEDLNQKFIDLESITGPLSYALVDLEYLITIDARFSKLEGDVKRWFQLVLKAIFLNYFAKLNSQPSLIVDIEVSTLTMYKEYFQEECGSCDLPGIIDSLCTQNSIFEREITSRLRNFNIYKSAQQIQLEANNKILADWGRDLRKQITLLEGQVEGLKGLIEKLLAVIRSDDKYKSLSEFAQNNLELILQWQVLGEVGSTVGIRQNLAVPLSVVDYYAELRGMFRYEIESAFGRSPQPDVVSETTTGSGGLLLVRNKNRGLQLQLLASQTLSEKIVKEKPAFDKIVKQVGDRIAHRKMVLNAEVSRYREQQLALAESEIIELIYLRYLSTNYLIYLGTISSGLAPSLEDTVNSFFLLPEYTAQINTIVKNLAFNISSPELTNQNLRRVLVQRVKNAILPKDKSSILFEKLGNELNEDQLYSIYKHSVTSPLIDDINNTVEQKRKFFSVNFDKFFQKFRKNITK